MQIFSNLLGKGCEQLEDQLRRGPKNLLDAMPDTFSEVQLETLRVELGKSREGTKALLRQWQHRKFVRYSNQTGLYTKTEVYTQGTQTTSKTL